MHDTSPEVAALFRQMLLERSGAERLEMSSRMFDAARAIVLASFPSGLSEPEIKLLLCERFYGDEVDLQRFAARLFSR
jgi:hypothetical protein